MGVFLPGVVFLVIWGLRIVLMMMCCLLLWLLLSLYDLLVYLCVVAYTSRNHTLSMIIICGASFPFGSVPNGKEKEEAQILRPLSRSSEPYGCENTPMY